MPAPLKNVSVKDNGATTKPATQPQPKPVKPISPKKLQTQQWEAPSSATSPTQPTQTRKVNPVAQGLKDGTITPPTKVKPISPKKLIDDQRREQRALTTGKPLVEAPKIEAPRNEVPQTSSVTPLTPGSRKPGLPSRNVTEIYRSATDGALNQDLETVLPTRRNIAINNAQNDLLRMERELIKPLWAEYEAALKAFNDGTGTEDALRSAERAYRNAEAQYTPYYDAFNRLLHSDANEYFLNGNLDEMGTRLDNWDSLIEEGNNALLLAENKLNGLQSAYDSASEELNQRTADLDAAYKALQIAEKAYKGNRNNKSKLSKYQSTWDQFQTALKAFNDSRDALLTADYNLSGAVGEYKAQMLMLGDLSNLRKSGGDTYYKRYIEAHPEVVWGQGIGAQYDETGNLVGHSAALQEIQEKMDQLQVDNADGHNTAEIKYYQNVLNSGVAIKSMDSGDFGPAREYYNGVADEAQRVMNEIAARYMESAAPDVMAQSGDLIGFKRIEQDLQQDPEYLAAQVKLQNAQYWLRQIQDREYDLTYDRVFADLPDYADDQLNSLIKAYAEDSGNQHTALTSRQAVLRTTLASNGFSEDDINAVFDYAKYKGDAIHQDEVRERWYDWAIGLGKKFAGVDNAAAEGQYAAQFGGAVPEVARQALDRARELSGSDDPGVIAATAASWPVAMVNSLASGTGAIDLAAQGLADMTGIHKKDPFLGKFAPLNYNTIWQTPYTVSQALGEAQYKRTFDALYGRLGDAEQAEKKAQMYQNWYNLSQSMGQSTVIALMSMAGVPGSLMLLSGSAATQTMQDLHKQGYSDGYAVIGGIVSGFAEYITEEVSIEALMKTASLGARGITGRALWGQLALNLGGQIISEASEEGASDIVNLIADEFGMRLLNGGFSQIEMDALAKTREDPSLSYEDALRASWIDWAEQTGQDILYGGISGGLMGMGGYAVGEAVGSIRQGLRGSELRANGSLGLIMDQVMGMDEVIARGLRLDPNTAFSNDVQIGRTAQRMRESVVLEGIRDRLVALGEEDITADLLSGINALAADERLTPAESKAIQRSKYGAQVSNELADYVEKRKAERTGKEDNRSTAEWTQGLEQQQESMDAMLNSPESSYAFNVNRVNRLEQQYEKLKAGNPDASILNPISDAITKAGADAKVAKRQGQLMAKILSGENLTAKEMKEFDLNNQAVRKVFIERTGLSGMERLNNIAPKLKQAYVNRIVAESKMVQDMQAELGKSNDMLAELQQEKSAKRAAALQRTVQKNVFKDIFETRTRKENNAARAETAQQAMETAASERFTPDMTEQQVADKILQLTGKQVYTRSQFTVMAAAYYAHQGQLTGNRLSTSQEAAVSTLYHNYLVSQGLSAEQIRALEDAQNTVQEAKAGEVVLADGMNPLEFNARQRASYEAIKQVAEALGLKVYLYETDQNNGNFALAPDGAITSDNGWYDPNDDTIHLDINAGAKGQQVALFAGAHEITHWFKKHNAEKFEALKNFLFEKYRMLDGGVTLENLINDQIAKAQQQGRTISREVAEEEVVADACETMLTDADVLQTLEQLRHNDQTVWEKIVEIIRNIVEKIRAAYEGIGPNTREAQILNEIDGAFDELKTLWAEGVSEAAQRAVEGSNGKISEETAEELAELGLTVEDEVVTTPANAELMRTEGYEKPQDPILHAGRQLPAWGENYKIIGGDETIKDDLVFFTFQTIMDDAILRYLPTGTYAYDTYGPLRTNQEYRWTFDMDTSCPRTFQYVNYRNALQRIAGRPLTFEESMNLMLLMRKLSQQIPCTYCYVETKRVAKSAAYLNYFKSRAAVMSAATDEEALKGMYSYDAKKNTVSKAAREVFDGWRKDVRDGTALYPTAVECWTSVQTANNSVFNWLDEQLKSGAIVAGANVEHATTLTDINNMVNEHFGVTDSVAKLETAGFVNEWLRDTIAEVPHIYETENDPDVSEVNQDMLKIHHLAANYANSSSSAKSVEDYVPYTDQLKNISDEDKKFIMGMGGIRKHSSNDFRIDYVIDYFQFFADLAAGGWIGHTYTKSVDYCKIFGRTGDKINASIAMDTINGKVVENHLEGMRWADARWLRKHYGNIGPMAMVTDNAQLSFALNTDWIDMIIPFHASGLPVEMWKTIRGWTNYTSQQLERYYNADYMKKQLKEKGIKTTGLKSAQIQELYEQTFGSEEYEDENGKKHRRIKKIYDKDGKRKRPHFYPYETEEIGPNGEVQKIPGHGNNVQRYFELCKEYGVHPRFYGIQVTDADGNLIDVTEHPGYLKLIKETARTDTDQTPIRFTFNEYDKALGMTPMEYALQRLHDEAKNGGYANTAEDSLRIVPMFEELYLNKDRPLGWLPAEDESDTGDRLLALIDEFSKSYREMYDADLKSLTEEQREAQRVDQILRSSRGGYDYSVSFAQQIDDYIAGKLPTNDTLVVTKTPNIFKQIGLTDLPMTYAQGHLRTVLDVWNKVQRGIPLTGDEVDHAFGPDVLKQLPHALKSPIAILQSTSPNNGDRSIIALVDLVDNGKPLMAAVRIDGEGRDNGRKIDSYAITSVYRRSLALMDLLTGLWMERQGGTGIYYINAKKAIQHLRRGGVLFPVNSSMPNGLVHTITESGAPVNTYVKTLDNKNTKQFRNWFGGSKVVDTNGDPMVMYHGTTANFTTFAKGDVGYHVGTESQAQNRVKGEDNAKIMPLYVSIQNPLTVDMDYGDWHGKNVAGMLVETEVFDGDPNQEEIEARLHEIAEMDDSPETDNELRQYLRSLGYDGIKYRNEFEVDEPYSGNYEYSWIAFNPNQLKSIYNIGLFSENSDDIYHSSRERIAELPEDKRKIAEKALDFNEHQTTTGAPLKTLAGSDIRRGGPLNRIYYKVGKVIGGRLYLHKSYINTAIETNPALASVFENAELALHEAYPDFEYNCVNWAKDNNEVQFQSAPGFDTEREPVVGVQINVSADGTVSLAKGGKPLPQIWHHKWEWVGNDYTGFDVRESWEWSKEWLSTIIGPSIGGSLNAWNKQLDGFGLPHDNVVMHSTRETEESDAPIFQGHTSKGTSIVYKDGKLPILFGDFADKTHFVRGGTNLDMGGGKTDVIRDFMRETYDVDSVIFDPFNRNKAHNMETIDRLRSGERFDTATCSNVLNVIDNEQARANVILEIAKALKPHGEAYFTMWKAPEAGERKKAKDNWQEARTAESYMDEIRQYFNDVTIVGGKQGMVIARDPKPNLPRAVWQLNEAGETIRYSSRDFQPRLVLEESTVNKYLADYAAKSNPNYAQAYITYMSPSQFLDLTTSVAGRISVQQSARPLDAQQLGENSRVQPIFLRINTETGEVEGHEGRHRMVALNREGVDEIPVLLFDSRNKYNKVPLESLTLTGQDFGNQRSYDTAVVTDVLPLSYANREEIIARFATPTSREMIGQKYGSGEILRYSGRAVQTVEEAAKALDEKFGKGTAKNLAALARRFEQNAERAQKQLELERAQHKAQTKQLKKDLMEAKKVAGKIERAGSKALRAANNELNKERRENQRRETELKKKMADLATDSMWARKIAESNGEQLLKEQRRIMQDKFDYATRTDIQWGRRWKQSAVTNARQEERGIARDKLSLQRQILSLPGRAAASEARRFRNKKNRVMMNDDTSVLSPIFRQESDPKIPRNAAQFGRRMKRIQEGFEDVPDKVYRAMVNDVNELDKMAKLETRTDNLSVQVNIVRASGATLEAIYRTALVDKSGNVIGDSMENIFLCHDENGKFDEKLQKSLEEYMFHKHNVDRMSLEERAVLRVREFTAAPNRHWLVELSAAELAREAADGNPIVQEYVALLRWANNVKNKAVLPGADNYALSADQSQLVVEQYENDPDMKWVVDKANQIYQWWDQFMRNWAVGASISEESYADMRELYPHYVPTYRVDEGGHAAAVRANPSSLETGEMTKAAKGSTRPLIRLEDQFVRGVQSIVVNSRRNDLTRTLVEELMFDDDGTFSEFGVYDWAGADDATRQAFWDFAKEQDKAVMEKLTIDGKETYHISCWVDGVKMSAYVNRAMFEGLSSLFGKNRNAGWETIGKIGSKFTAPMKNMITGYNPTFALKNFFRDQQTALANTNNGVAYMAYVAKAAAKIATNDDDWVRFQALGGVSANETRVDGGFAKAMAPKNPVSRSVNKIKDLIGLPGEISESVSRFAEYLGTLDRLGGNTYENQLAAIRDAAEITVDFGRHGSVGRLINMWVPYWNAGVQGLDKAIRNIKDQPDFIHKVGRIGRAMLVNAIPMAIQIALIRAMKREKDYEELSDQVKDNYYCMPIWGKEHKFFKFPKTQDWAVFFSTPILRIWEGVEGRDDKNETWLEAMCSGMDGYFESAVVPQLPFDTRTVLGVENVPVIMPLGLDWALELAENKNWAGSAIIPYNLQEVSAREQYDEATSWLAYQFGQIFGASPMQIDYILNDYMGNFWGVAAKSIPIMNPLASRGLYSGELSWQEKSADILQSLASPFITDNRYSNGTMANYYEMVDQLEREVLDAGAHGDEKDAEHYEIYKALTQTGGYIDQIRALTTEARGMIKGDEQAGIRWEAVGLAAEAMEFVQKSLDGEIQDPRLWMTYHKYGDRIMAEAEALKKYESSNDGDFNFSGALGNPKTIYNRSGDVDIKYDLKDNLEAQDMYSQLRAEEYRKQLDMVISSPEYKSLKPTEKAARLEAAKKVALKRADERMLQYLQQNKIQGETIGKADYDAERREAAYSVAWLLGEQNAYKPALTNAFVDLYDYKDQYSFMPADSTKKTFKDPTDDTGSRVYVLNSAQQRRYSEIYHDTITELYDTVMATEEYKAAGTELRAAMLARAKSYYANDLIKERFAEYLTDSGAVTTTVDKASTEISLEAKYSIQRALGDDNAMGKDVTDELVRLYQYADVGEVEYFPITTAPKSYVDDQHDGQMWVFTQDQREVYMSMMFDIYQRNIRKVMASRQYQQGTDYQKAQMLCEVRARLSGETQAEFKNWLRKNKVPTVSKKSPEAQAVQKDIDAAAKAVDAILGKYRTYKQFSEGRGYTQPKKKKRR